MKVVIFCCAACGLPVTGPLVWLEDRVLLSVKAETDYIPGGHYVRGGDDYLYDAVGQYLINRREARNIRPHPDYSRRQGCCGLDGCDGRNVVCANGHEVGTERSDCWLAHSVALDPSLVTPIPAGSV